MEVCFECCIISQGRAGKLLWDWLYWRTVWQCSPQVLSFRSFSQFRGCWTSCHSTWLLCAFPVDGRVWGLAEKLSALLFTLFLFFLFPISNLYWVLLWKLGLVRPRWRPLAGQIAISTLSMWFEGRPTCLSRVFPQGWNVSGMVSRRAQIRWSACLHAAESHALQ